MHRLVAYAYGGVQRFVVADHPVVVGADAGCDVTLGYPGVAPRHLELLERDGGLLVRDLGTRKGIQVNGRRVQEAPLQVLDEVRLGSVTLLVEEASQPASVEPGRTDPTLAGGAAERLLGHVGRLSHWVLADSESQTTLESLVRRLLAEHGGGGLFLFALGEEERNPTVRFSVASEAGWVQVGESLLAIVEAHARKGGRRAQGATSGRLAGREAVLAYRYLTAFERRYLLAMAVAEWGADEPPLDLLVGPLADLLILGLVHHVGRYEPILPGSGSRAALVLPPGLVVGESAPVRLMLDQLSAAVDPPVNVLLRGERGTGRESLARALHASGPGRDGPFVVALAAGAEPGQVSADLFGAEVPGRSGPVQRIGKLAEADGGTLYLADVDQLPADAQARLVRVLRSGELLALGGQVARRVTVRVIAGSHGPLEPLVARDRFRGDLVSRLAQLVVDVPPLRERREDIPLLVQTFLNRYCHQLGKRVRGVTVRAMATLTAYGYPGNLLELENIVRQMVAMCPNDQPVDLQLLPARVTDSETRLSPRVDPASDLDLDRLLDATSRAAIREALRRTHGNRAQAARLLGLSRNGLAAKMARLAIDSGE